jgi:hypothetical protein
MRDLERLTCNDISESSYEYNTIMWIGWYQVRQNVVREKFCYHVIHNVVMFSKGYFCRGRMYFSAGKSV